MSIEDLKKSIHSWKDIVEDNAYADSVGAFAESIVSASPVIDKSSTWAAAGVAAVAGLIVTNIDKMASVYEAGEIRCLFSMMAVSMLFALIQKYYSSLCLTSLKVMEEMRVKFPPVLESFDESEKKIEEMSKQHNLDIKPEYDFEKVKELFINLYPKWSLFYMRPRLEKSFTDRNHGHKFIVKAFVVQSNCALIQYIFVILFVCLAAIYV